MIIPLKKKHVKSVLIILLLLLAIFGTVYYVIFLVKLKNEHFNNVNANVGEYVSKLQNIPENWLKTQEEERKKEKKESQQSPIYCLMVTGKDEHRIDLASVSVKNFLAQSYKNKHLIIINHHPKIRVLDKYAYNQIDPDFERRVFEFFVKKSKYMTLGTLRNVSLQLVPMHAIWIPWDDDDWRPNYYLEVLYNHMFDHEADAIVFTRRYEFNVNTNFAWGMELKSGFPIIMCKSNPLIKYMEKDSMEDLNLINTVSNLGYNVVTYQNHPRIYIRLVHQTNTSLYADNMKNKVRQIKHENKKKANYIEFDISDQEKKYVLNNVNDLLATIRK